MTPRDVIFKVIAGEWNGWRNVTARPPQSLSEQIEEALSVCGFLKSSYKPRGSFALTDDGTEHFIQIDVDPYMAFCYNFPCEFTLDGRLQQIIHVSRMRDGGTTIIDTKECRLIIPTAFAHDKTPKLTIHP